MLVVNGTSETLAPEPGMLVPEQVLIIFNLMRLVLIGLLFMGTSANGQLYFIGGVDYSPHKIVGRDGGYSGNLNQWGLKVGFEGHSTLSKLYDIGIRYGFSTNFLLPNKKNDYPGLSNPLPLNTIPVGSALSLDDNYLWLYNEFPVLLTYRFDDYEFGGGVLFTASRRTLNRPTKIKYSEYASLLLNVSKSISPKSSIRVSGFIHRDDIFSIYSDEGDAFLFRSGFSIDFLYKPFLKTVPESPFN